SGAFGATVSGGNSFRREIGTIVVDIGAARPEFVQLPDNDVARLELSHFEERDFWGTTTIPIHGTVQAIAGNRMHRRTGTCVGLRIEWAAVELGAAKISK